MSGYVLAAAFCTVSGGVITVQKQQNVASVTRNSANQFTINFTSNLSTSNFGVIFGSKAPSAGTNFIYEMGPNANSTSGKNAYGVSSVDVYTAYTNNTGADPTSFCFIVFDPTVSDPDIKAAAFTTFSGAAPTVQAQANIASLTKQTSNAYRYTFSSSLADANYSEFSSARPVDSSSNSAIFVGDNNNTNSSTNQHTTTQLDVLQTYLTGSGDPKSLSLLIRDSSAVATGVLASVRFTVSGGVCTIVKSNNVSSVTYSATGTYIVNFTSTLADTNYGVICTSKFADSVTPQNYGGGPQSNSGGSHLYSTSQVSVASTAGVESATFDVLVFDPSSIGTPAASIPLLGQAWL